MEDQRVTNNKHAKKTTHLSISKGRGGGGIAGLLVFGGALAVTGLIAVATFSGKKNKAKAAHHKPKSLPVVEPQESDDTTQGLLSVLQDSKTNDESACCPTNETSNMGISQINSSELVSTQTLILEKKLELQINNQGESPTGFHQEIVFTDDSPLESAVSSNGNGDGEKCLESSFDSPCFKAEDVDMSESQEALNSIEIIEEQYENATPETEEEEIEDVIVEDDGEDVALEIGENSSQATGRSSLDSNEAAIWPAELIEEPQQQFKGGIVNFQSDAEGAAKTNISADYPDSYGSSDGGTDSSESSDYPGNAKAIISEATPSEKANLYVVLNDQLSVSQYSSRLRTWIIPMLLLALLLLLLLLTHGKRQSIYVLDGGNSVISP